MTMTHLIWAKGTVYNQDKTVRETLNNVSIAFKKGELLAVTEFSSAQGSATGRTFESYVNPEIIELLPWRMVLKAYTWTERVLMDEEVTIVFDLANESR